MKNNKKILQLFSTECGYDKKHKLNTLGNKLIPINIINDIEKNGITTEQICQLAKKGFDCFKYKTQITLHGVCNEFQNAGQYKFSFQNKNKSIGIKWIAVDRIKKMKLIKALSYFEWQCESNSMKLYPYKRVYCKEYIDAAKTYNEFIQLKNNINKNLFFGEIEVSIYKHFIHSGFFVDINLYIQGIYEKNINTLLEIILGKNINEINEYIEQTEREKKQKYQQTLNEIEKKQKKLTEKISAFRSEIESTYDVCVSNELKKGDIFFDVNYNYEGDVFLTKYYMSVKYAYPYDMFGNIDKSRPSLKYKKKPLKVYLKK